MTIDRRTLLISAAAGATTVASAADAAGAGNAWHGGALRVFDLRTAGQLDPLAVADTRPMLAWRVDGPPGTIQSAYQIRVASSPSRLTAGVPDLWDSGRTQSAISTGIAYAGKSLRSRERCFWQVRIWNEAGAVSRWSAPACWETALLARSDWHGQWLAVEGEEEREDRWTSPPWVRAEVPQGRKTASFHLNFHCEAGDGVLTIATRSHIAALSLDGRPLPLHRQDYRGYGGPPAEQLAFKLTQGHHVLTADVAASRDGMRHVAALAAHLRLRDAEGSITRIAEGWSLADPDAEAITAPARDDWFPWPATGARLLRRHFRIETVPSDIRLHVAALGAYRVWINGIRVGDDELQAEPAEYRRHVPYRTYDISHLLRRGDNVVGVMAGDGFYASYQAPDGRYAYGPAPRRLLLAIEQLDGTPIVASDSSWRHAPAPITLSEIYAGEDNDLRLAQPGWLGTDFDDSRWLQVWEAPEPEGALTAPMAPPIRVTRTLRPQVIRRLGPASHLVDFGQNFAGRVRLSVQGTAGQEIVVSHAEILSAEGTLDRRNLREARAQDRYILADTEVQQLEPAFTFQGFRYAQVDGLEALRPEQVTGLVLNSDLEEIGTLRTSQPLVQKLWLNTLWSQRSNFRGNPTDCPQRDERLGWTGDAQIFWETAAFNMHLTGFTRAFTGMLRDDQAPDGAYPMWSPAPKGLGWNTDTPTPGWADAGVMLPYIAYLHGGDRSVVDDNWAAMTAYCEGILRANPDGLWRDGRGADLGDWLALDAKSPGDETTPKPLIATAMLARDLDQMAAMAEWTGRDAAPWRARASRTRAAFADAFLQPDGMVGNGSQTSYILALRLGLVPNAQRGRVGERLAADIVRRGRLLTTGFLGTPLALDALADTGNAALAFDLLLRTDYPSWGYMARRGATTMWERWNGDVGDVSMNSYNHYAFGSVCAFLYRRLGGVAPLEPGYRRFRVAPLFDPRFASSAVSVDTPSGRVEVAWQRRADKIELDLLVPANTRAQLEMPGVNRVYSSGRFRLTSQI